MPSSTKKSNLPKVQTPWLNADQAAAYIGVSPWSVRRWYRDGYLPGYKSPDGRTLRFHIDELDGFVRGDWDRNTSFTRNATEKPA